MDNARFTGLTWDHPRGYNALEQASADVNRSHSPNWLHWKKQPLEGFESAPIGELAAAHDLLVLDHPHIGEAVDLNCLHPLEEFFSSEQLAHWESQSIGAAMKSYHWEGKHWALPLDVASQVLAHRPDLLDDTPPRHWDDVIRLSENKPVGLSIDGPHAFLSLYSLCVSLGKAFDMAGIQEAPLLDGHEAWEALDILQRLYRRIPEGTQDLNPIGLLETMASTDRISLIPLVFGYVNYSKPSAGKKQVLFNEVPTIEGIDRYGSVLGGTGIALCKHSRPSDALLEHLAWLMDVNTQRQFIPNHDGQPSAKDAWQDDDVNNDWGNFYRNSFNTVDSAVVRPRHNGYIHFQTQAAALIKRGLADGEAPRYLLDKLNNAWLEPHS